MFWQRLEQAGGKGSGPSLQGPVGEGKGSSFRYLSGDLADVAVGDRGCRWLGRASLKGLTRLDLGSK